MMIDYSIFILTHGRASNIKTLKALKNAGYTGKIYFVVDDEDEQVEEYKKNYGEDVVVVFNKKDIAKRYDQGDNFNDRRSIFYARNASFEIAKKLGIEYFIQLDDDYGHFSYKFNNDKEYEERYIKSIDDIFQAFFRFLIKSNALTIAFSQNGDFIGGKKSGYGSKITLTRKAMNSFFCRTDKPVKFIGRINDDVNAYTKWGSMGDLFFTSSFVALSQATTQKSKGGMAELYNKEGTYIKSFYSVMYAPSCVKIASMGDKHKRIHHKVNWNNAVPKILKEIK